MELEISVKNVAARCTFEEVLYPVAHVLGVKVSSRCYEIIRRTIAGWLIHHEGDTLQPLMHQTFLYIEAEIERLNS